MGLFTHDDKSAGGSSHITIISEHLSVTGEITGPDNVYINGTFRGRIVTQGEVSIGPKGNVEGEILTKSLLVSGHFEGNIECEAITIFPTGQVTGSLFSTTLKMHPGGYYFGESSFRIAPPVQETTADESKTHQLSVVSALPLPKEASNAPVSAPAQKSNVSKNEAPPRDKFNTVARVKPVPGKTENKPRPPEASAAAPSSVPVPNDPSEQPRWHSSWSRR
ncbi:MAG: polymer-forming cytoskeletal protein [Gammaproteobacteria bacterium]|nr:polymer-forming cytoskeletal protein [Gammaproteobacteria bacterium]